MPDYNTDLMIQVREQINAEPELHHQVDWEEEYGCGTTRCIAGWAIFLATGESVKRVCHLGEGSHSEWKDPQDVGADLLGLDEYEATWIFYEFSKTRAARKLDALIEAGKNGRKVDRCAVSAELGVDK